MQKKWLYSTAILLILFLILFIAVVFNLGHFFRQFSSPAELARYLRSFGLLTVFISILLLIIQTLFTPVPLFILVAANGFIFGVLGGIIISLSGSVLGATIAFLAARLLGRNFLSRFLKPEYLDKVHSFSRKDGPKVVFFARLIPVLPSSIVSYLAGLSNMRFTPYFLATTLGKLPEIVVYSLLGHGFGHLDNLPAQLFLAILITIIAYFFYRWHKKTGI
ncbi:TVP38/TMEM64 family protein [Carboxydothermus ferrireducens]|uniref:TVP38/TMEM64 family membrane protein n=1 Tax=Carboxydothermus ferrireducens DSM 11255 TaxID=1119529 RepID=A0ABX2REU9_9THEO|nr:TVP38/TMEM64 family protein [Carboxydothermus ferrireducens]NYE58360.1 putative membrane protein YdjX (TVP38/TMEM64 family) [Carboxydothermus ferrireducens DSM 11255]